MEKLSDSVVKQLEALALDGAKQIHAYFTYQGKDPMYINKAKLGAVVISGYAKLRQSETGRMAIELAYNRTTKTLPPVSEE